MHWCLVNCAHLQRWDPCFFFLLTLFLLSIVCTSSDLVQIYTLGHQCLRCTKHKLLQENPPTNHRGGELSFQSAALRLWNSLPETVKLSNSNILFKSSLKSHLHIEKHFVKFILFYCVMLLSLLVGCSFVELIPALYKCPLCFFILLCIHLFIYFLLFLKNAIPFSVLMNFYFLYVNLKISLFVLFFNFL